MAGDEADAGAPKAARIAFVTNAPLLERGGGLYSDVASVRREILLPARTLRERGAATHVISLAQWPHDEALALVGRCDRVVFGKLLQDPGADGDQPFRAQAASYRALLSSLDSAARIVFCFADDHFDRPAFRDFYREVAARSLAWVTSSEALKQRLETESACPIHVYPEPVETSRGVPRVPRRGLRERVGLWIARRTRVGVAAWRLKLLWFGHPTNAGTLAAALPELRSLAQEIPLAIECVTQPGTELDRHVTAPAQAAASEFHFALTQWSPQQLAAALHDCDAVVLPQLVDDPRRRAKSNNRMVDALHAGRFVLAHPLPSYQALERYAWVGDSLADGVHWLLRHPGEALRRLRTGQDYVAQHHSLDALADFWRRALDF